MFPVSYVSAPIEMPEGRGAVVAFADIEERLRAEKVLREHDALLAAREASLRRIATLVAGGAASAEVMTAGRADRERLPDHIEDRLAGFTELVATAISNSASREELALLAEEQAALRRVATLVARESS